MSLADIGKMLKGEKVVLYDQAVLEKWTMLIEDSDGETEKVLRDTEKFIQAREVPGLSMKRVKVNPARPISGNINLQTEREYLLVTNDEMKDFKMYLGARDYGKNLDCQWYLTCEPGMFKQVFSAAISKNSKGGGSTKALSLALDLFQQQNLIAYVTLVHHAFLKAVGELVKNSGQDPSKIDRKSKGFLNIC